MKATTQTLRLVAAIALAFAAMMAAAAKLDVKVIDKRCDGIQYWVKYTINGVEYRSDQAPIRVNQHAWENMSDEDRQTTVETIYGVWNAREEQFGSKADEIGYWYDKKKGWVEGAEILTASLVKRDFPDLYENFSVNPLWFEIAPEDGATPEIQKLKDEAKLTWDWAREAYGAVCNAEYIKAAAAVKSISGGLIELITDKCLVPNITPAGAGGLAAQIIGTALDYVNNIAGIQSGIINNVVGKRPTTEQTLEAIKRCDMVISESRSFIATCIQRIADLGKEIKVKNEQYYAEEAEAERRAEAIIDSLYDEFGVVREEDATNPELVAELKERADAYWKLFNVYTNPPPNVLVVAGWREAYEKKLKAAYDAFYNYAWNKAADINARYKAWRTTYVGDYNGKGDNEEGYWLGYWIHGTATLNNDTVGGRVAEYVSKVKSALAENKEPEKGSLVLGLTDAEASVEVGKRNKYIQWIEEYFTIRAGLAPEAVALAKEAFSALALILKDKNALYSSEVEMPIWISDRYGKPYGETIAGGQLEKDVDLISVVGCFTKREMDEDCKRRMLKDNTEELEVFSSARQRYKQQVKETEAIRAAESNETAVAKQSFLDAFGELVSFAERLPKFVTEQYFVPIGGMYPGLHADGSYKEKYEDDGAVSLKTDSELGRTFLDPDHPASVATAIAYRDNLNALMDEYLSLKAKANHAQMVYRAQFGTHKNCGVSFEFPRFVNRFDESGEHVEMVLDDISDAARLPFDPNSSIQSLTEVFTSAVADGVVDPFRTLTALARDFNNRNNYHATEMDIFGELTANEAAYTAGDGARYQLVASTARGYAKRIDDDEDLVRNLMWNLNPPPLYGFWSDKPYNPNATSYYNRAVGSYAYYAPGYFETVFAGEPDPFDDFVAPLLNQIDVARAAAFGITLHIVTFDANGGNIDMASRTVTSGAAVGELPAPARSGWTFDGWFTAASGGTKVTETTIVSANVTYYAHWTQGGGGGQGGEGGGQGGGGSVTPGYEVLDAKDIVAPYAAPKAVVLRGVAYDGGEVVGVVELKLGKVSKGKSKISGSFTGLDGKKVSIKAVTVTGIDGSAPVSVSLAVKGHGTMDVTIGGSLFAGSLGGKYHVQSAAVGGAWTGGTAKATVDIEIGDLALFPGTLLTDFLPDEETATVKNGKWTFAKAASVKWAKPKKGAALPELYDEAAGKGLIIDTSKGKTNLSGLKLAYTPKKGTFKGSFKLYELQGDGRMTKLRKYTMKVNGIVVDGKGTGFATCRKPMVSGWPVRVE